MPVLFCDDTFQLSTVRNKLKLIQCPRPFSPLTVLSIPEFLMEFIFLAEFCGQVFYCFLPAKKGSHGLFSMYCFCVCQYILAF